MSAILFCDWKITGDQFDTGNLFDNLDFNQYDIIFFDPLQFAVNCGLRKNQTDLWVKEYINYSETEYLNYLNFTKETVEKLKIFLEKGGIWVIRCNFPNSNITVRKRSLSSSGQYTTNVISPYSWLDKFLGKYHFPYGSENKIKFTNEQNAIFSLFRNVSAEYLQTQNHISKGKVEVWANNGQANRFPVISRVTFPPGKGEIFFIPKFIHRGEHLMLAKAFSGIAADKDALSLKPQWLNSFQKELDFSNPCLEQIKALESEIKKLQKRHYLISVKSREYDNFINLLYKNGRELTQETISAFMMLDFNLSDSLLPLKNSESIFYGIIPGKKRIMVSVESNQIEPVGEKAYQILADKVKEYRIGSNVKGIIVANSDFLKAPDKRKEWFSQELIAVSRQNDICLISTLQLFRIICLVLSRSGSDMIDEIKKSLRKDILDCDGQFKLNDQKYFARSNPKVGVF